jgi:fatty-acyl-CoA synthase
MEIPKSRTLGGLLEEQAGRYAERPAIVFEGETWSFAELNERVQELAKGLLSWGVSRGDHVALLAGNRPEWLLVCFAAARIGAVLCPMNTWYKQGELDYGIRHSDAVMLLTVDRFLKRNYMEDLAELMPELGDTPPGEATFSRYPNLRSVIMLGESRYPGTMSLDELVRAGKSVSDEGLATAAAQVSPEDMCYILYTSGSTAAPKAVMLQHYGAIENCFQIGERQHLTQDDRLWLVLPLFYGLASVNGLPAVYTHGGCIVLQEWFDPGRALEIIERERCTVYYGLGNITRALLSHPDFSRRDLSSLKKGVTGFTPEDKRLAIEGLGVENCCSIYGLTESYGNCAVTDADDPLDARLHTQGKPLPGWDFKIVDPSTWDALPQGELGMVLIKGYVTVGYYKDAENTAQAFDSDGYFITGDLGSIDEEGRFRYHARLKDMIKTGGINVSPLEVEQILETHPLIRQAHVVGVRDPARTEIIVAFVEPTGEVTEEDVRQFVKERAASFKVPHRVFFRTETDLPRLASGKIAKNELRAWAEQEVTTR